jgi:hypothetical protein
VERRSWARGPKELGKVHRSSPPTSRSYTRPMSPSSRRIPHSNVVALLAVGAFLAGCSGSANDGDLPPRLETIRPSESPSPGFTHSARTQIDAREVAGDGWTIQVPAKFEEQTVPGAEGTTTYRWIAPAAGSQPPLVAVVTDAKPRADAIEQSKTLEITTELDPKVKVTRSELDWPGAQRAILLQWTQPQQGTTGGLTTWQLMVQVNSGLILNALAIAPDADFASLRLAEVLSTFTPTS